jgi:hypothetical protein
MMLKKFVAFTREDGGLSLLFPNYEGMRTETEEDFIDRIIAKDIPANAVNHQILSEADYIEFLEDKTFYKAWFLQNGAIEINLVKAKEIKINDLRIIRDEKLKELDVQYMRADESGDSALKATIADQKQELRDMPQVAEQIEFQSIDELKAYLPNCLA